MGLQDKILRVDDKYFTGSFRQVINDHIFLIRSKGKPNPVSEEIAYKYHNNFNGLLNELGVLPMYWYATLRANDLRSPTKCGVLYNIIMVDTKYIDELLAVNKLTTRDLF